MEIDLQKVEDVIYSIECNIDCFIVDGHTERDYDIIYYLNIILYNYPEVGTEDDLYGQMEFTRRVKHAVRALKNLGFDIKSIEA